MAWFTRFTRFGQAHMIYAQEQSDSCGPSCAIMVNFKLKAGSIGLSTFATALFPSLGGITGKLLSTAGKSTAVKAEQQVYSLVSATYDGTEGTVGTQVAALLNKLDVGRWKAIDPCPGATIANKVMECYENGWPTIIGNSWYTDETHSRKDAGGHWVVVDTINRFGGKLYASICDPLTGNVHVTPFQPGQPFAYDPSNPIGWEAPLDDYRHYREGYESKGYSLMDGIVYCETSKTRMVGLGGAFAA